MNANLMTKKIEMTKSEAKEAGKLNTEKFHELRQFMAAYPGYEVQIKAPSKRKVELRGLDYKYMRAYILSHDDEKHSKMETFKTLIAQDKKDKVEGAEHLEAAGYLDVRAWFLTTFPEIKQTKDTYKGLTYEWMRNHIATHEPEEVVEEKLKNFDEMVYISKCHRGSLRYPTIKKWFLKEYPDVAKFGTLETAEEAQEEEPKNQSVIPMPESQTEKKTA